MRSALTNVSEIEQLETAVGTPGNAWFVAPEEFDFRSALDAAAADGVSGLADYRVLD